MNKLVESAYVLHKLWSCVKRKILKYNLEYLILPVIYLFTILLVVPTPKEIINKVTITKMDSYITKALTLADKRQEILKNYNLTENEFKVLVGITLSEAEQNSYEDAYAVINTIYNRTHSKNWIKSVNSKFGDKKGESLYYQAISPNQFTVYKSGSYKKHMNDISGEGYRAIIDFLYSEKIMHNYLSFRSHSIKISNSESFSENGNNYFNILKEENRV